MKNGKPLPLFENFNGGKKSKEDKIQDQLKSMGVSVLKFTFYDESSFKVETYGGSLSTSDSYTLDGKDYTVTETDVTTDDEHDEGLKFSEYEFELKD